MSKQIYEPRPLILQRDVERRYAGIWDIVSKVHNSKGSAEHGSIDWEDWCYLPMPVWFVISRNMTEKPDTRIPWMKAYLIAAVGTWRLGKGVYRFDQDLYSALISTPIAENLPVEIFFRLPEYCIYIETPRLVHRNRKLHGFFAFLEDKKECCPQLCLVYDGGDTFYRLHFGIPKGGNFKTEFEKEYFNEEAFTAAAHAKDTGITREMMVSNMIELGELATKTLSLLLYLCSDEPDYGDKAPPVYAMPKKVKTGLKWFPAAGIKKWDVGVRIGAAIRKYRQPVADQESFGTGSDRASVRPHMRRAHWHGYWTGKRTELLKRKYILHWIPPIPVNMHDEDAPTVIRPVKK